MKTVPPLTDTGISCSVEVTTIAQRSGCTAARAGTECGRDIWRVTCPNARTAYLVCIGGTWKRADSYEDAKTAVCGPTRAARPTQVISPLLEERALGMELIPMVVSVDPARFAEVSSKVLTATPKGRRAASLFVAPPIPPPPLLPPLPLLPFLPVPPPPPVPIPLLPPLPFASQSMPALGMVSTIGTREELDAVAAIDGVQRAYLDIPMGILEGPRIGVAVGPETWVGADDAFRSMEADVAREKGLTGKGVKVAVLDTGAEWVHPQLRMGIQIETAPQFGLPVDENGHGSWCTTSIKGNRQMVRAGQAVLPAEGVAPGCSLLSVKVLGYGVGAGLTSTILFGMNRAVQWGADIVSMSLGGEGIADADSPYTEVIQRTKDRTLWVIAAGNSGPSGATTNTPGSIRDAFTVGSYSLNDAAVAAFSSRGPTKDGVTKPDVLGPGGGRADAKTRPDEKILSGVPALSLFGAGPAVGYTGMKGTSMATPRVAGLLALVLEAKPRGSGEDITARIKRQATAAGGPPKNDSGSGPARWSMFVP